MGKRRRPGTHVQKLAGARIERLWEQSRRNAVERPDRSKKWMLGAKRIAQKARIKLPRDVSRQICKTCGTVWVPGTNCRVRIRTNRSRHISVTCFVCGTVRRFPVKRQS